MRSLGSKGGVVIAAIFFIAIAMKPWQAVGQGGANVVTSVSAASFDKNAPVAPESIVAAFGTDLATTVVSATTQPLPTSLAGTTVKVKDSANTERPAQLFFVSPGQVNYIIPRDTATGVATITITNGDGKVSTGVTQIARAAPSLFTANASGQGVPAAVALRVKPGGIQITEPVSPLNLGPENEQIYLILFGTGIRGRNDLADVTVRIGDVPVKVDYAGAQGDFVGLDQVNAGPVSRSLIGRCKVNLALTINSFGSANLTEIEMAGASGTSSSQISFNPPSILAGDILTINGAGFSSRPADNLVRIGCAEARVDSASPTQLNAYVPFGAETAPVSVRTSGGEGRGANPLMLRTSISGVVEDTARQPLMGVTVRVPGQQQTVRTNANGAFVFPDPLPPGVTGNSSLIVEIDGSTVIAPRPYPKVSLKLTTLAGRDNPFRGSIALQQIIGPAIPVGSSPTLSADAPSFNLKTAIALTPNQPGRSGNIVFEIQPGTTARFPNGATSGILNLTVVENQRTPVKLPPNIFSSVIVQITEFDVRLNPGGKLTFPNTDKLPASTQATLYRLDQRRESPTLGEFIDSGKATVSADGERIETELGAITDTAIYLVAAPRLTTTVTGRVLDSDGATPVRQARVRCRGQEAFTDGNGGFTIRNVLVNQGDQLSVEASFQRSTLTGRVDRIQRDKISSVVNGVTAVGDLMLPSENSNRPPVILVPTDLTLAEGDTRNINFVAGDPDPGQRVVSVVITPPRSFITLAPGSNDVYNLRLTPGSNDVGTYEQILTATDNLGGQLTYDIRLRVNRPPFASPQSVTLDEDTSKVIQLTGNDPGGLPLNYSIVSTPRRGQWSSAPPNLTYTPNLNENGSDSFSFRVNNGFSDSQPATVSIFINPVNDAPVLSVPGVQIVDEGKKLGFTISASDVDVGDKLTFLRANFPDGATLTQLNAASAEFSWTPSFTQSGTYTVTLRVSDDGVPPMSDSKTLMITVKDINRPPILVVPGQQSVNSGLPLSFTISASDPDPGQTLSFSATNLPTDAVFNQISNQFSWTPGFLQNGTHTVSFTVIDGGLPPMSDTKSVTINVMGQWAKAGPLEGGPVRALFVKDTNIFAGTDGGGIFRSSNQGQSWTQVQTLADRVGRDVRAFTAINNDIFVGTFDAGVFRSRDQGQTWTSVNNGLMNARILSLATMDTTLFAGAFGGGVFRSTDQGQNWTAVSEGLIDPNPIVNTLAVNGNNLFAGTDNGGVFLSTNQGQSWRPVNIGLTNLRVFALAVHRTNLFAGTGNRVFRSTNNGQSWMPIRSGMEQNTPVDSLLSDGTNLYAGTYYGVFVTANNGDNWTPVNTNLETRIFSIVSSGTNLFAGTVGAGVFRTTNGGQSWTKYSNGLTAVSVHALIAADSTTILAGTRGSGLFRATDNGQNWTLVASTIITPFDYINAFVAIDSTIFAGGDGLGVLRSNNQGQSWERADMGLDNPGVLALAVSRATSNTALFAGTYGGVFRSTNLGQSWTRVSAGLPQERGVISLALIGQNLFAGTDSFGVYYSNNQGDSWSQVNNGLPPGEAITALAVRGADLFAGTNNGVFRSPDQGRNWIPISMGLTDAEIRAFVVSGQALYAGTGGGVFRLSDDGQSWSAINTGLTNTFIKSFLISGTRIFVGTVGGGVFIGQ